MKDRKLLRIIEEAQHGDENAFGVLMQSKAKNILFIALSLMHDKTDAEDAAQEAMLTMKEKIPSLKNVEAFDSWMYRVVFNTCLNEKRKLVKQQNNIELIPEKLYIEEERHDFLPERFAMDEASREELRQAIDSLPQTYRMCLILFYYEGLSYAEIAEALEMKVQDVTSFLSRAKSKLRSKLEARQEGTEIQDGCRLKADSNIKKAGIASVPVLTQFFNNEVDVLVGADIIERFVQASHAQGSIAAVSATAAKTLIPASINGLLSGLGGRLALAVVTLGVTFATVIYISEQFKETASDAPTLPGIFVREDEQPDGLEQSGQGESSGGGESASSQAPLVLGEENAEKLNELASGGSSYTSWRSFVEQTQLVHVEYALAQEYRYDVYTAANEEEDMRLIVIVRTDKSGTASIAKKEGSYTMEMPQNSAIMASFEEWK